MYSHSTNYHVNVASELSTSKAHCVCLWFSWYYRKNMLSSHDWIVFKDLTVFQVQTSLVMMIADLLGQVRNFVGMTISNKNSLPN